MDYMEAAISGAQDFASAWYNNRNAMQRQHSAQDFSAQQYASRYQTTVKDLIAAGLNPMLAYQQGGGSPPSGSVAGSTGRMDLSAAYNQQRLASAEAEKIKKETVNLNEQTNVIISTNLKLAAEIDKIGEEMKEIRQAVRTGKATEEEKRSLIDLNRKHTQLYQLQVELAKQEKNIKRPEEAASATGAAEAAAHVSRVLKPLIDAINGALKTIK